MRRHLALLAALAFAPSLVLAAVGTSTNTETTAFATKKIVWSWTSGTAGEGGTVTSTTTATFQGKVIGLTTDPGSTAPTDSYDITIADSAGHDVLLGAGADRDTANTEHVAEASLGAVAGSRLTLSITNAGDAKQGTVVLFIR